MEPASALPSLPFRKVPRKGQVSAFEAALDGRSSLNVQCPTGYGKTFINVGCYSLLKKAGRVNRLLVIFPTVAQLNQFVDDGPEDLLDAAVDGPRSVIDVGYFGLQSVRRHQSNTAQVFAVTIQSMIHPKGRDLVDALLSKGRWMVTVDEYHHYGIEKSWGEGAKRLPAEFLLALSATPYRPDDDGAFGPPAVTISYRTAAEDKAVKPLCGHSYIYRIDAILQDGSVRTFTTDELAKEAGANTPDAVERFRIQRRMRWSPKYVSPLVTVPIERMLRERIATGHRLQSLVGAMCVSHAQLVAEQIMALYPELSVDWVGTGENGRTDEDNRAVLKKFCPPKDARGNRTPTLDILVHVGMAGEGLDSIHVSEVIHLNNCSICNSNTQEIGRAARHLKGVIGHSNFDSTSEYARAKYVGDALMDAMDGNSPQECNDETGEPAGPPDGDGEPEALPDEPTIEIWNMELEGINSGDPEVLMYKQWLVQERVSGFTEADVLDPSSPIHDLAVEGYKNMRRRESEQHNDKARVTQLAEAVKAALSTVTGRIIRLMTTAGGRFEKTLPGDIKKRINIRKKQTIGEVTKDEATLRAHYQWIKRLESEIIAKKELPSWLV